MKTSRLHFVSLLLALMATTVAAAGSVDAWLDRTQIAEGETVQLTLEAQGQLNGDPDTAPLLQDFDILGQSTGRRMSIVNGQADSRTTWTLVLRPKHGGTLTIPAVRVGSAQSSPLSLQVSAAPVAQAGSDADIVVESELSTNTPYLQGQVLYTVRLLHAVPLKSGQLSEPASEQLLVQRLGDDREYATTRNGRRYQVIERRYALFPQASGTLELAAPVFDGEVPDTSRRRANPMSKFFGNDAFLGMDRLNELMATTRQVRVRGEPASLEVRARPDAAQGAQWLPATQLELHGSWVPDGGAVHVGEPLTLQLDLQAAGLTGGQLPGVVPESVDGFDVYPDQAQRSTDAQAGGVSGRLQQKIAFIPRRAGKLVVPAIDVYWWDTGADQQRHATLPERVLQVLPAAGQTAPVTPAAVPAQQATPLPATPAATTPAVPEAAVPAAARIAPHGWWPWVSAALAAGWLLTLATWWWRNRRSRSAARGVQGHDQSGNAARARRQFLAACKANDAVNARRTLLEWAAAHWPQDPPRGLQSLAQRMQDPVVQEALDVLDRAVYAPAGSWDGAVLARCLPQLPKQSSGSAGRAAVLAPLYPESPRRSSA